MSVVVVMRLLLQYLPMDGDLHLMGKVCHFILRLVQRGFKASIEERVDDGRVDVSLIKDSIKIACEIAVSNSVEYEIKI